MSTDEPPASEAGDFKIGEDGRVLVFDGERWAPYKRLSDTGPGTILRDVAVSPEPPGDGAAE